jgi:hypothetical protein
MLGLLNQQLEARGYIIKTTTIVDAAIIESSRKRPSVESAAQGTAPDALRSAIPVRLAAVFTATKLISVVMRSTN